MGKLELQVVFMINWLKWELQLVRFLNYQWGYIWCLRVRFDQLYSIIDIHQNYSSANYVLFYKWPIIILEKTEFVDVERSRFSLRNIITNKTFNIFVFLIDVLFVYENVIDIMLIIKTNWVDSGEITLGI